MTQPPITAVDQLRQAGAAALRRGDPRAARDLFEQVVAARPADAAAWYGLALACRGLDDQGAVRRALDQVLSADPGHIPSLLMRADHFARAGEPRAAAAYYRAVVARAPAAGALPPELRNEVARAAREAARYARDYEAHLREILAGAGFDPSRSSSRFAESLDLLFGRKEIFFQAPKSFFFPGLPQRRFYEREEFPWLDALEAQTDEILDELLGLVRDEQAFTPYVRSSPNRPPNDYQGLLDSLDWSACFLIQSGAVVHENARSCPCTMEALKPVPLAEAPGRTPSVLFSLLRPGARIPPHNGLVNTRLICHLPLITPEGCALRVGNETRPWIKGRTLIFDDSIEHEAWNTSDSLRVVLLFDVWRPELTLDERALVAALLGAVESFGTDAA